MIETYTDKETAVPSLNKRRYNHISTTYEENSAQLSPNNHSAKRHQPETERVRRKSPRTPKPTPEYEQFISDFQAASDARFGRTTSTGFVRRAEGEIDVFIREWPAAFNSFDLSLSSIGVDISSNTPVAW